MNMIINHKEGHVADVCIYCVGYAVTTSIDYVTTCFGFVVISWVATSETTLLTILFWTAYS